MECPVCKNKLHEYAAAGFNVDICRDGCGGIWFDKDEFEKCNQHDEPFPEDLLTLRRVRNVIVDRSKLRNCPECPGQVMTRIELDPEIRLEIDQCAECGGTWLDIGELDYIRKEDGEMAAINARVAAYNRRVAASVKEKTNAHRVQSFVNRVFGTT